MTRFFPAIVVFLMLTSTVDGQVYRLRITECDNNRCTRSGYGSAVCVGQWSNSTGSQSVFVTCEHCTPPGATVEVSVDRKFFPLTVHARDGRQDIAICSASTPGVTPRCLAVADRPPQVGELVQQYGYPLGREFRQQSSHLVEGRYPDYGVVTNRPSINGESGGAIVHNGDLIGLISAVPKCDNRMQFGSNTLGPSSQQILRMFYANRWAVPRCGAAEPRPQDPPEVARPTPPPPTQSSVIVKQGPPGPQGPPGRDAEIDYGRLQKFIEQEIGQRVASIPRPRDGIDGKDGQPGKDAEPVDYNRIQGWLQVEAEKQISEQIDAKFASLPPPDLSPIEQRLTAIENRMTTLEAKTSVKPAPEKRVLYFTTTGSDTTRETDDQARRLKTAGYPVTIITLQPTEVEVRDVPRVYTLPDERTISGAQEVSVYLATLTK